jgi:hypothetical protein
MTKADKMKFLTLLIDNIIRTCDDSTDDYKECRGYFKDLNIYLNKWLKDD